MKKAKKSQVGLAAGAITPAAGFLLTGVRFRSAIHRVAVATRIDAYIAERINEAYQKARAQYEGPLDHLSTTCGALQRALRKAHERHAQDLIDAHLGQPSLNQPIFGEKAHMEVANARTDGY